MLSKRIRADQLKSVDINNIANLLKQGLMIVVPTETIYGVASSMDPEASMNVYQLKQRTLSKPLPVLIDSLDSVKKVACQIPDIFWTLADNFLPGTLTVVLKKNPILNLACLDKESVAVRFSNHPVLLQIAKAYGAPLLLSSANTSGQPNATDIAQIESQLGQGIELIIDDGPIVKAEPSTIISLVDEPKILRHGAIKPAELEQALNLKIS